MFTGCSNDDTDRDLVPGGNEVAVTFAANLVNNPASRSAFDQSENKVTVVTFKYRASSNSPDDGENVFTPSIKYTVTIQTQWNGIVEGPSVDI